MEHISGKLAENERLVEQARSNTLEQFALGDFKTALIDAVIEGLDNYQSMATQVLNDGRIREGFSDLVMRLVYQRLSQVSEATRDQ